MRTFYQQVLANEVGTEIVLNDVTSISGGCIHNGVRLSTDQGDYFLKWSHPVYEDIFKIEYRGLNLLRETGAIPIPEPLAFGQCEGKHYLLMEFVTAAPRAAHYWSDFGQKLANLHQVSLRHWGLDHDNYIGSLPQDNSLTDNWEDFFRERRLQPQVRLASKNGLADKALLEGFENLYRKLPELLPAEKPSLLHGDLWSGNVLTGQDGLVCLIDPAVYYGHREIELAFTKLFGGFSPEFYQAYDSVFPRLSGFEERVDLYNLYPLLVHLNLFGRSYYSGVMACLKKYT